MTTLQPPTPNLPLSEESVGRPTYVLLLAITSGVLLLLPFVTTFDDFLTAGAMRLGLDRGLQGVVPAEARMVVALLSFAGVKAAAYGSEIVLQSEAYSQPLFISWNCIGWQSLALFALSLATGLRAGFPLAARFQVVLIGLLGTVLVNLVRVAAVALLAARAGYVPALLLHDYGGTLLVVGWLFLFWALAYRWILPRPAEAR